MKLCIVGTSRCGTTLLRSILHKNPEISLFNETHWIPKMYEFFGLQSVPWNDMLNIAKKTSWDTGRDLFSVNTEYSDYTNKDELLKDFIRELKTYKNIDIQTFSDLLAKTTFNNPIAWGDKTPDYGYYMSLIQTIWPKCKFIHVTRDGLATARSMSRHPGCQLMISGGYHNWCSISYDRLYEKYSIKPLPITKFIESWSIRMNRIRDESKRLSKYSYIEVEYEKLIRDPKFVMNKLDEFAELPYTLDHIGINDLNINVSKLQPVKEFQNQLLSLTVDELRLLNQGYGKIYFNQFHSLNDIIATLDQIKNLKTKHSKNLLSLSILASGFSKNEPEIVKHASKYLIEKN